MARVPVSLESLPTQSAADVVGRMCAKGKSKKRRMSARGIDGLRTRIRELHDQMKRGQPVDVKSARDLVDVYAWLHAEVYGVEPAELTGDAYRGAVSAAASMVRTEFADDYAAALTFVRWVWVRERDREKWRRENEQTGARIQWRLQFGKKLLTDYRVAKVRANGRN